MKIKPLPTSTGIAIVFTIFWIGVSIILIQAWNESNTRISELGGFIGGMASSLAVLWLVMGYFQQQKELSLITKALELQSTELKRTADEQKRLATSSNLQTELLVSPFLAVRLGYAKNRNGVWYRELWAQNIGAHAAYFDHRKSNITLLKNEIVEGFWCAGDEHYFEVGVMEHDKGHLTITFYNRNGDLVFSTIQFERGDSNLPCTARLITNRTIANTRVTSVDSVGLDISAIQTLAGE